MLGGLGEGLSFDSGILRGYWKGTDREDIAEQVLDGILIHDFGGDIVKAAFPNAPAYHRVDELYEQILQYLLF